MHDLARLNLIGSSPAFRQAVTQIRRFAGVRATVLITGESGTGKELAARAIHYLSDRRDQPFVPVNCGSLPDTLLESELFGHERGAFTDAKQSSLGLIGEADGGTLFLDEIDSLSLKAQTSLLRFLQDRTYRRVGSGNLRHADVRVVAASNADLEERCRQQHFRIDLLYRLNVLTLHMPALRERENDTLEVARDFVARLCQQYRHPLRDFHPDALHFLRHYHWPGNVRELENLIHRDFLLSDDPLLGLHSARHKLTGIAALTGKMQERMLGFKEAKARCIEEFEKGYIRDLLDQAEGNLSAAARLAGKERSAFGKLVRKYGLGEGPNRELVDNGEAPA